jgi:methanophenazine hydrogenase
MGEGKNGLGLTRRSFLAAAGAAGAALFLRANVPAVAAAIAGSGKKLVWLRGSGCGGCTASLLNGGSPDILAALNKIKLEPAYHDGLMLQQGVFVDGSPAGDTDHNSNVLLDELVGEGGYVLVVEGAIPDGPQESGRYCMSGAVPFKRIFIEAAPRASCIVAAGTCASYGGISRSLAAADAAGVAFAGTSHDGALARYGIENTVINVPGCPTHPEWLLLVLADVLAGRHIDLDIYGRPKAFFGSAVHDSCPRRGAYDRAARDAQFSDGNCLYELGCKGPLAYADCPTRRWNGAVSMCTQAGGPCVACVEPAFPDAFMPFFEKAESKDIMADLNVDDAAKVLIGAAAVGAGLHAVKRIAIGESGREDRGGKK